MKPVQNIGKKNKSLRENPKAKPFPVVAIGASLGGLRAVSALFKFLPPDTGMAFIYVQHLDPNHKNNLTSLISQVTKMQVEEIEDMEIMKPDHVYVIPYNKGIKVTNGHIKLIPRTKGGAAITIDVLFSSLAATHKANVIGIVLSGNAHDGTIGLKSIKKAGGITFVQDGSAQAGSMPESAIAAGVADFILSPEEIALEIERISKNGSLNSNGRQKRKENIAEDSDPDLKNILRVLHKEKNIDFSHYKVATIKRRIKHRMQQCNIETTKAFLKLLTTNNNEVKLLCKDLLINVTSFFRDAGTFRYLKTTFFPKLLKSKKIGETLRIWIPACSTGQEVYSIAMLLAELQDKKTKKIPIKIFATDLSEEAVRFARKGEYSQSEVETISKQNIKRYFTKTNSNFIIAKEIREMCLFAPQNLLSDPPFFNIDFISCRNILIYFDVSAQKKALATIHFALKEGGYLLLGKSETTGTSSQLFAQLNNEFKVYSRKNHIGLRKIPELIPRFPGTSHAEKNVKYTPRKVAAIDSEMLDSAIDSVLLSRYMPACAIINKDMNILQFRGSTSTFLMHPSGGKASLNILKMMRPEFAFELRAAISQAIKTNQSVNKKDIEINIDAVLHRMSLEVSPLKVEWSEPLLMVVFTLHESLDKFISTGKHAASREVAQKDSRIKKLVEALKNARLEIDSVTESQETAYEELQGANEEIISANEEFQTLNEELETSKEEIEATNDELTSANHQLKIHNELLTESYDLSEAIIATLHEPLLILNANMNVKSANVAFYQLFNVKKEETEGKSVFELGDKQWDNPQLRILLKDVISKNTSFQGFQVTHRFPGLGEKIMLLNAHRIIQKTQREQLILMVISDITETKALTIKLQKKENEMFAERLEEEQKALKKSERNEMRYSSLIQSLPVAIYTCDKNGYIQLYNDSAIKLWGREPIIGKDRWWGSWKIFSKDNSPLNLDSYFVEMVIKRKRTVKCEEIIIEREDGTRLNVLPHPQPIFDENGVLTGAINTIINITDLKKIEKELVEAKISAELAAAGAEQDKIEAETARNVAEVAVKAKQQFLSNMSHEIRTPMNAIIGFTKVLIKTNLTASQKEYLAAIKISGDALIVLINDILDLAKVDAGKMTFEKVPFKMAISISEILHVFELKIQEKNLKLVKEYDTNIPDVLVGDPVRLNQIIINLLGNALKFTSQGKITVSVRLLRENEKKATIKFSVADTGIGIPKNKIENIFENFQQASNGTTRLYGGTGLGLAIVKQLVEPQGGTITVKSKIDVGSTFSFILSFQKTKDVVPVEIPIPELDKKKTNIKVLVVEDMPLNQLLMKTLLHDFGFEEEIAENGKIAIEKIKNKTYDIVLMDLQMPEMNGFEATEYIRNTLKSEIPIIALTADVTTTDLTKCKAIGMNDYLAKPLDDKLLYNKILNLVKKNGSTEYVKVKK